MTTALAFIRDNAALILIGVAIVAVLLVAEWRRFRSDQRSIATVYERLFAEHGPVHDDCSRDSRGGDRYSNHFGGNNA